MAEQYRNDPTADDDEGLSDVQHGRDAEAMEGEGGRPPVLASAKHIPRPTTSLAAPPRGHVAKVTVSLLGDVASVPSLEDVVKINTKAGSKGRTPIMTVIQAVLAKSGGTMALAELAAKVRENLNRPFPASPYTPEEFIYVMVRNCDNLRIRE